MRSVSFQIALLAAAIGCQMAPHREAGTSTPSLPPASRMSAAGTENPTGVPAASPPAVSSANSNAAYTEANARIVRLPEVRQVGWPDSEIVRTSVVAQDPPETVE